MTFDATAAASVIARGQRQELQPGDDGGRAEDACRYSDVRKIAPTTTPVTPAITADAETSERIRQVDGGTSGSAARRSSRAKPVSRTRREERGRSRCGRGPAGGAGGLDAEHQGQQAGDEGEGARERRAGAAHAAARCRGRRARSVPTTTATPIGTLMKNTARQPSALVSAPPKSTPAAMPRLPTVPQTASAVCRCLPGVGGHDDRQRGRGEQRGARALRGPRHDERSAGSAPGRSPVRPR